MGNLNIQVSMIDYLKKTTSSHSNSIGVFLITFVTVPILSIVPTCSPFRAWNQHLLKRSPDEHLHIICVFSIFVSGQIEAMHPVSLQMWTAGSTLSFYAVIFLWGCLCLKMRLPHASPIAFCFHTAGKTGLIHVSLWNFGPLCLTGTKPDINLLKIRFRRSFFQSNLLLIKWRRRQGVHSVCVCLVQIIALWERHTDSFRKHKTMKLPWQYIEIASP